jgi:endonuclease YncB( thermonuclease family)
MLSALFSFLPAEAAESTEHAQYERECGNPLMESMLWRMEKGTVAEIMEDGSLILLTTNPLHTRVRVFLAGVDTSKNNEAAKNLLTELTLNRQVNILVRNLGPDKIFAVVKADNQDINRELIKTGTAQYRQPEAYAMSSYTACTYRIEESKARAAKKGIWKN